MTNTLWRKIISCVIFLISLYLSLVPRRPSERKNCLCSQKQRA